MKKFVILFGPPGSGKGTQVERLEEDLGLPIVSPGALFRHEIENETELGKKIEPIVKSGKLVNDKTVEEIVAIKLKSNEISRGAIFDGYPRRLTQQEFLLSLLEEIIDEKYKIFVALVDVDDEIIKGRLGGRRVCDCGDTIHIENNPSKVEGICDECGDELYIRDDDKPEVIEERLHVYHKEVGPMLKYWEDRGELKKIDGSKDIDSVYTKLISYLKEEDFINND